MEEEFNNTKENEKNYYVNILDNLNVGFFIISGGKLTLFNKFITNIMENYNKLKENDYENEFFNGNNDQIDDNNPLMRPKADKSKKIDLNKDPFGFLRFLIEEPSENEEENDSLQIEEKTLKARGNYII